MSVLNSPLECAVRLLMLLDAWYPSALSKRDLVYLDYAVVHTSDFGGPESLHPKLPDQVSELAVKHALVSDGLKILMSQRLCRMIPTSHGLCYLAGDSSSSFLRFFRSRYAESLSERAFWLLDSYSESREDSDSGNDGLLSLASEIGGMLEAIANGER